MDTTKLQWFQKYVYVVALILGVIALLAAQAADTNRARLLYTFIALGPVVAGLLTILRYKISPKTEKYFAKIIAECAWVCLSFGLGFLMMLPSSYYAVQPSITAVLVLNALLLAAFGLYTLINIGKMGFSLTP